MIVLCALLFWLQADGVFKSLPFEQCMQTVRLTPSQRRQLNRRAKGRSLSCNTEAATDGEEEEGRRRGRGCHR